MTAHQLEQMFYENGVKLGGGSVKRYATLLGISAEQIPKNLEHARRGRRKLYCPRAVAEWYAKSFRVPTYKY
jgi:hypothetical protein